MNSAQGSFVVTGQATIPVTSSTTVAAGTAATIKVTVNPRPQNGRVTGGGPDFRAEPESGHRFRGWTRDCPGCATPARKQRRRQTT